MLSWHRPLSSMAILVLLGMPSPLLFGQLTDQTTDQATGPALSTLRALRTTHGAAHAICGTGTLAVIDNQGKATTFPLYACANHHAMRGDTTFPQGIRTVIFNGGFGIVRSPDGSHSKLTGRNSMLWRPIYFPPLLIDSLLADDKFSVEDHASTDKTASGQHLHLQRSELLNKSTRIPKDADDVGLQIDPTSHMATSFSWNHSLEGGAMQGSMFPALVSYGNYTTISGVTLPQTITTTESGHVRSVVTFTSLQINPSIAEGFFSLSKEEIK